MSIELVTGRAGQPHVSSDDVAGLLRAAMGAGSYVLGAALPKISMSDANTCTISPAELLLSGRHVKLTGANSVTIESGGQATYRIDYICVRYRRDISLGIESAELVEIKGEAAPNKDEATAPNVPLAPEINTTSQQVDVPIIQIDVDNLAPTAAWLLPLGSIPTFVFATMAEYQATQITSQAIIYVLSGSNGSLEIYFDDGRG